MKKILMAAVGLMLIAGGIIAMFPYIEELQLKGEVLRSCSVSTGGGMLGGYTNYYLKRQKDGTVTLTVTGKETHADRETTAVCEVDPKELDKINEIVLKYHLYPASRKKYSDHQVMDADSTSISFTYEKHSFRISEYQKLSRKMREGFRAAEQYLYSLRTDEAVITVEPQQAMLYLKSGYTLRFKVEDLFDGKLDAILGEEHETSRFLENGIVLAPGSGLDLSGAEAVNEAAKGTIVYDSESMQLILLYTDYEFEAPVYVLARLDGYPDSACPLIAEMEGPYRFWLN